MRRILLFFCLVFGTASSFIQAQTVTPTVTPTVPPPVAPTTTMQQPGQVFVSGTVPDEASKAAVLVPLRELYGAARVVDQIVIGPVALPPNWNSYVQKLINPSLLQISRGELKIDGTVVSVRGEVGNEAQRQKIPSDIATSLDPSYTVNNRLRVSASEQNILDNTLGKRTVEFESSKATMTPTGLAILDEMSAAMRQLKNKKVEIIGHTDNQGLRATNQTLSAARAEAVKQYLVSKGINGDLLSASGQGADRPVTTNDTVDGRARNRRIEFRIVQ